MDVPPQNLLAERAVLGAALLDASTIELLDGLRSTDFFSERHRLVYEAIRALAVRGEAVDALTVRAELERQGQLGDVGDAQLAVLQEEAALFTHVGDYIRIVRECARKRELARLGHEVSAAALNGHSSCAIIARLQRELETLEERSTGAVEATDACALLAADLATDPGVVVGILERNTLGILGGAPKLGKTALALGLALCVATQTAWLGFPTSPGSVLMFQSELPRTQIRDRLRVMLQELSHPLDPERLRIVTDRTLRLDDPESQARIVASIRAHRPFLVIFDPLARFMAGDENRTQDMGRVVAFLDRLTQEYGVTVLVVHHVGKPSKDDPREGGQRLRGSSALFAAADSVLLLERSAGAFSLAFQLRHAAEPEPLLLERGDTLWFRRAETAGELQCVPELAGEGKRFKDLVGDLIELHGMSRAKAARLIRQAKTLGFVRHEGGLYRSHGLTRSHLRGEPDENVREA